MPTLLEEDTKAPVKYTEIPKVSPRLSLGGRWENGLLPPAC